MGWRIGRVKLVFNGWGEDAKCTAMAIVADKLKWGFGVRMGKVRAGGTERSLRV